MLRTPEQIKERLRLALVENINHTNLVQLLVEPENRFSQFLETLTNNIYEITLDEITFRKRD